MANLAVTNTFVDGTVITASGHNQNFSDIVNYINNRNDGSTAWDTLKVTNASSVPLVVNNGAGTNAIVNFQDDGTNVMTISDGGQVLINVPSGSGQAALLVRNHTSSGLVTQFWSDDASGPYISFSEAGTDRWFVGHDLGQVTDAFVIRDVTNTNNPFAISNGILTFANQSGARAYLATSNQTVTAGNNDKIQFNAETYDIKSEFDSATNYRFTATKSGIYKISCHLQVTPSGNNTGTLSIHKNNSQVTATNYVGSSGVSVVLQIDDVLQLAASDYVEIFLSAVTNNSVVLTNSVSTFICVNKIA